jgi:TIR domain-containing protein
VLLFKSDTPPGLQPQIGSFAVSLHPAAFLSYAHLDDPHEGGRPTELRRRLSGEVSIQTGEEFDIFQDRNDIEWGEQWQQRIENSLDCTTLLIPILTPGFFKSPYCRSEFKRFLDRKQQLECSDLNEPAGGYPWRRTLLEYFEFSVAFFT